MRACRCHDMPHDSPSHVKVAEAELTTNPAKVSTQYSRSVAWNTCRPSIVISAFCGHRLNGTGELELSTGSLQLEIELAEHCV